MNNRSEVTIPFKVVGSNVFGRYDKISVEQTYNMIISDGFLVDYAGYEKIINPYGQGGVGRRIESLTKYNKMIAVISENVFLIDENLSFTLVGSIDTFSGPVFIDNNNIDQVAICDEKNTYILNLTTNILSKAIMDFTPSYVSFQNGYFLSGEKGNARWRLSELNNGLSWTPGPSNVGGFQSKADNVLAVFPFPSKSNLLFVMGSIVTQAWNNTGVGGPSTPLFPYQLYTSYNIDYGTVNNQTIAFSDNIVMWLGINEKSGPVIMYSTGGDVKPITTDGISFKFANLKNPSDSSAFIFKQDGHIIYQITFHEDKLSYAYDFNTDKFFTVTDQHLGAHIAKNVAFFGNDYYFVSSVDGNLYKFGTQFSSLDGHVMPRIRLTAPVRESDSSFFEVNKMTITLEQGQSQYPMRIDTSMSKNGGESFGTIIGTDLNPLGKRTNQFNLWKFGRSNDITFQFRVWGLGRAVMGDGTLSIAKG